MTPIKAKEFLESKYRQDAEGDEPTINSLVSAALNASDECPQTTKAIDVLVFCDSMSSLPECLTVRVCDRADCKRLQGILAN